MIRDLKPGDRVGRHVALAQKLLRITKAIGQIPRRGIAPDGWTYAKIEDVLEAVNAQLNKKGLLFTGSLAEPVSLQTGAGCVRDVVLEWVLEDTKTGETKRWRIPGAGFDFDEKAIAKAVTASRKTAYIIAFNLKIEEAPEAGTQEAADYVAKLKIEREMNKTFSSLEEAQQALATSRENASALRKMQKEAVRVTWPAGVGHAALFLGRLCVLEHKSLELMENCGKWLEKDEGWLVPRISVNSLIDELRSRGCRVISEAQTETVTSRRS